MKYLFIALLIIGIIFQSNAQSENSTSEQTRLMEKSNDQYTGGLIFLGTGTALIVTALVIPNKYDYYEGTNNGRVISILAWTGTLAVITSVPLFLSAGQNARLAARLSLQNHSLYQPIPLGQPYPNIPSLSLKIPL